MLESTTTRRWHQVRNEYGLITDNDINGLFYDNKVSKQEVMDHCCGKESLPRASSKCILVIIIYILISLYVSYWTYTAVDYV